MLESVSFLSLLHIPELNFLTDKIEVMHNSLVVRRVQ